jgi:hypothetical protein
VHDAGFVRSAVARLNARMALADNHASATREGQIRAARAVDMVEHVVPARLVLAEAATTISSRVALIDRLVVVRFEDAGGALRTLVWEPRLADAVAATGFNGQRSMRSGVTFGPPPAPRQLCTIAVALERCGVQAADIDFVGLGDLRGHDLRHLAGTVRPLADEHQPRAPLFESAQILVQARELAAVRDPHPIDAPWYVAGSGEDLIEDRVVAVEGDVSLGAGVSLISTPGLTAGHQSLLLNTRGGLWIVSSNGVASDCWQPLLSKIPGVRRSADAEQREAIVPAAGAHNAPELYDSLLLERSLADASRADPRWLTILPAGELASRWRQWPAVPTYSHGGLSLGRF